MEVKTFSEQVKQVREASDLTIEDLFDKIIAIDPDDVGRAQLTKVYYGKRRGSVRTMLGFAEALEVAPERFYEYRLGLARMLFDDREFGLERAFTNLEEADIEPITIDPALIRSTRKQRIKALAGGKSRAKRLFGRRG